MRIQFGGVSLERLEHGVDIRLQAQRMQRYIAVWWRGWWHQQRFDQQHEDIRCGFVGFVIDIFTVNGRLLDVTEYLNVNCKHLLMFAQFSQYDGTLFKQIVAGEILQHRIGGVVVGFLQKVNEFLVDVRTLQLFLPEKCYLVLG